MAEFRVSLPLNPDLTAAFMLIHRRRQGVHTRTKSRQAGRQARVLVLVYVHVPVDFYFVGPP